MGKINAHALTSGIWGHGGIIWVPQDSDSATLMALLLVAHMTSLAVSLGDCPMFLASPGLHPHIFMYSHTHKLRAGNVTLVLQPF